MTGTEVSRGEVTRPVIFGGQLDWGLVWFGAKMKIIVDSALLKDKSLVLLGIELLPGPCV